MAVGDIVESQTLKTIKLLEARTTTNGSPVGQAGTAGVRIGELLKGAAPRSGALWIASTAGSGSMTVTMRLWGHLTTAAIWAPLGTGTGALKGVINGGVAIPEDATIGADVIRHVEEIGLPWAFDFVWPEIVAIGGTATAISAWLAVPVQGGGA